MATLDDVAEIIGKLPEVTDGSRWGNQTWFVRGQAFAWERPLSKADIRRWGEGPLPEGPLLGVRVADLNEKEAVLAASTGALFTISHFDGYPAVLVHLKKATKKVLREAIVDGWLACAPEAVAEAYLRRRRV